MNISSLVAVAILIGAALPAQRIQPCQFTRINPTCGPVYSGVDRILSSPTGSAHVFILTVTKAPANAPGILAFSMKQARFNWPGTKCFLLIDPTAVLLLPFNANAKGNARKQFSVKGKLLGTVFSQTAFNRAGSPLTSNAQRIVCK
jgi:hypothetical protein